MEIEILQFIAGIGWRRFSISSQFVEGCTSWNPTRLHSDGRKLHGREFLVSQSLYLHFKQSSAVNSNKSFCDVIKTTTNDEISNWIPDGFTWREAKVGSDLSKK